jgi:iron(III) transport system substrate-binding protein
MLKNMSRREFIVAVAAASSGMLAAACGSAATTPTAAPAGVPASSGQTAPTGAAGAKQTDWDAVVEAARGEGQVVVQNPAGAGYRLALDEFARAYPGVEAVQQSFPDSATYIPKIRGEREAGIYSIDVIASTVIPVLQIMKPEGWIDPVRPLLVQPEVLDPNAWFGGFEARWADTAKTHVFRHSFNITRPVYINTTQVDDSEIKSVDDLLNPKWKGKIVTSDVVQGYIYTPSTVLRETKGEEFLRKLFVDQQPQMIRDRRQAIETLIRGNAAVGFGLHPIIFSDFVKDGLAGDVKNIDVEGVNYSGGEIASIYKGAPHPNAAKLFLNWLLSKEGQIAWSTNIGNNSARKDVPVVEPSEAPSDNPPMDPTQEDRIPKIRETQQFLKSLVT